MIENNIRRGAGDQHVSANIKLEAIQQQRVHHISDEKKNNTPSCNIDPLVDSEATSSAEKSPGNEVDGQRKELGKKATSAS